MTSRVPEQAVVAATIAPSTEGGGPGQSLDRSLASGIAWTAGVRGFTQAVQWAAALLVIRLLTPADYGLVAMATAYLGLVRMVSEFGLGAAIIQRRGLTRSQIANLNSVSVLFAVVFAAVSVLVAGTVANFFREPQVQVIIAVLSITFIFGGIEVIPRSLLKRELNFKRLAWIQAADNITYAIATLILAALGFGYWSLVLGSVIGAFVRMTVALVLRRHALAWPIQLDTIRSELLFGWHVVSARLALYVRQFADTGIVGRMLGAVPLGAYSVAWSQANIPVDRVTAIVSEVTPSILAAAQHDPPALRRYVRIITEGIAFLSFPATVGMAIVADDFVMLILGEKWAAVIAPLRVLALVGALRSITPILTQVMIATENARKNLHFTVTTALVIPLFVFIGSYWGLTGAALGWLIGHPLVMLPVLLPQALRAIGMSFREYLVALRPAAFATAAMAAAVIGLRLLMPPEWPLAVRFGMEVSLGAFVYGLGVFSTYRARLRTFFSLLRSARKRPARAAEQTASTDNSN